MHDRTMTESLRRSKLKPKNLLPHLVPNKLGLLPYRQLQQLTCISSGVNLEISLCSQSVTCTFGSNPEIEAMQNLTEPTPVPQSGPAAASQDKPSPPPAVKYTMKATARSSTFCHTISISHPFWLLTSRHAGSNLDTPTS